MADDPHSGAHFRQPDRSGFALAVIGGFLRIVEVGDVSFGWKVVFNGKTPPPGEVVRPDERLSWSRTTGIGAQHVVALFGATFVFPIVMGLDPNLAIMMSGVATILFLLLTQNRVPSYLGTSASFVGAVIAIRAAGDGTSVVTGAILVAGLVLVAAGLLISALGIQVFIAFSHRPSPVVS